MSKLRTMQKKTRVVQSLETDDLNITFTHDAIDGKVPDMVTAKAVPKDEKSKHHLDVVYYPSTNNLQITAHKANINDFNVNDINEVVSGIIDVLKEYPAKPG